VLHLVLEGHQFAHVVVLPLACCRNGGLNEIPPFPEDGLVAADCDQLTDTYFARIDSTSRVEFHQLFVFQVLYRLPVPLEELFLDSVVVIIWAMWAVCIRVDCGIDQSLCLPVQPFEVVAHFRHQGSYEDTSFTSWEA